MQTRRELAALLVQLNTVVVGQPRAVHDGVVCLLAGGHLLIEDRPGMGKTTLAQALARGFGLHFARVQFTADLMPSDLTGVSVYDRQREAFHFHPGPLFSQVLLADEINRASPRTQSALLEAMEERHVSVDGQTRALPAPFVVIATQNPQDQAGTFPLPESQLDRFLMRISLGYPDRSSERQLLREGDRRARSPALEGALTPRVLETMQREVQRLHVSEALLDYVQDLVQASRTGPGFTQGLSPRGAIALVQAARAQALLAGRDYVAPDDVQAVAPQVIGHRLQGRLAPDTGLADTAAAVRALLASVPLP
jgi:MoxR-like ATPase